MYGVAVFARIQQLSDPSSNVRKVLGITYLFDTMSWSICHIFSFLYQQSNSRSVYESNVYESETRRAVPYNKALPIVEVYPYSITNPMFLLLTVSLLYIFFSCKYNYFLTYRGLSYYYYYLCSLTKTQQYSNIISNLRIIHCEILIHFYCARKISDGQEQHESITAGRKKFQV